MQQVVGSAVQWEPLGLVEQRAANGCNAILYDGCVYRARYAYTQRLSLYLYPRASVVYGRALFYLSPAAAHLDL